MSSKFYKGAIWTNHVLLRIKERGITQETAAYVFQSPDKELPGNDHTRRFQKKINNTRITLIAKQNEKSEWVILSAWTDLPLTGSKDARKRESYNKYHKASFLKKFLITAFRQITGGSG